MGFFRFDEDAYIAECAGLSTESLQAREVHCHRGLAAQSFALGFGLATAAATSGAAWPVPTIAARLAQLTVLKLRIIERELTSRSIEHHDPDWKDFGIGIGSGMFGAIVGDFLGGDDGPPPENPGGQEVKEHIIEWAPGELAGAAFLAATDGSPPSGCSRTKYGKKKRKSLMCNGCSKHFSTAYSDWLHCCQCEDNYDVCETCAPSVKHNLDHQLYLMKGSHPKVHRSLRSTFDIKVKCKACNSVLQDTDIYSCEDCTLNYDICLSCYAAGRSCQKHPGEMLRQRV